MKYRKGFLLGKFYPCTLGHVYLIESGLEQAEELTVLVCSIASETFIDHTTRLIALQKYFDGRNGVKFVSCTEELPQLPEEDPEFWTKWMRVINQACPECDVVFSSENYGEEIAKRLPHAVHVLVDKERKNIEISGTLVREAVMKNYDFIIPTLRPYFNMRVAVMGPESVGKTTITERLAHHFNTSHAKEFGRELCEVKPNLYATDFPFIATRQERYIKQANEKAYRIMFSDTELLTTNIFLDLYHPNSDNQEFKSYIESIRTSFDLYLLLDIDLPAVQDGTRLFLHKRQEHFETIKNELEKRSLNYRVISGGYEQKFLKAVNLCNKLLANGKI